MQGIWHAKRGIHLGPDSWGASLLLLLFSFHSANFFLLEPSTIFQELFGINPNSGATGHTSPTATE